MQQRILNIELIEHYELQWRTSLHCHERVNAPAAYD